VSAQTDSTRFGHWRESLKSRADRGEPGLVTVVIPCYNAERFVGAAIDSALAQTHPSVEVIVIDDGSTDSSLQVIRSYESRVAVRSKSNAGACAARNDGLELARGEFVQFLDADDVLLPDAVERRLAAFTEASGSVFGERVPLDAGGAPMPTYISPHPARGWERIGWAPYVIATNIHTLEPLHRTSWACEVGGFDESFPQSQEPDFHLRLLLAGCRFAYLPGPVGGFRQHAEAQRISAAPWWTTDPDRHIEIVRHWLGLASPTAPGGSDPELRRAAARVLCNRAIQAAAAGAAPVAARYRVELLRLCPGYRPAGLTGAVARVLGLTWAIRLAGLARRARQVRAAS
jgi:hypothetical protein